MKKKWDYFIKNISNKQFLTGIVVFLVGQAITYYAIKLLIHDPHILDSSIDKHIPFIPEMIIFYSIFYPFVFCTLYYIFIHNKENFRHGIIIGTISYLIADIIFICFPTIMIRPEISYSKLDWLTGLLIKITYTGDNPPINCFPSIHCLFTFQVIYMTLLLKNSSWKEKTYIIYVGLLIAVSTVFVKQHYIYDIIGALGLCIIMNTLGYIFFNKRVKNS